MSEILNEIGQWPGIIWATLCFTFVAWIGAWSRDRPSTDERIRMNALALAIESHGAEAGKPHDQCFTARARHFEAYLKRGHLHG